MSRPTTANGPRRRAAGAVADTWEEGLRAATVTLRNSTFRMVSRGAFLTFEDGEPGEAGTGEALQETLFLQRSAAAAGPKLRVGLQGGGNVGADGIASAVIVLQYI
ncbi:hypothetical protein [Microbispora bryophytorum]|uniref:hypothetical protein n=1 Tax=Microbispora bryophytorum TaxID=1460882 RepID=UPI00371F996D